MSTRKDKTLTHREEQGSDTEELPWMRWGLSEETVSILTERLFMVGSSLTEHIGYVTKPAFARETCQTVGWQHFPPLALYPLACFTFPQDTPRMQVAMDIIREQLYLCSTPECESLRMWHHERLRKMPLHPATGTWCKKRRNILCVPGEETCQSQEQTVMHYGQLWEHLTEAKGWPETQACFWEVLGKDGGIFGRHSSPSFILLQSRHWWGAHTFDVYFRQDSGTHYPFWFPLSGNLWSQEGSVSSLRNSNFTLDSIPFLKKEILD